jgi:hypothetical protein
VLEFLDNPGTKIANFSLLVFVLFVPDIVTLVSAADSVNIPINVVLIACMVSPPSLLKCQGQPQFVPVFFGKSNFVTLLAI